MLSLSEAAPKCFSCLFIMCACACWWEEGKKGPHSRVCCIIMSSKVGTAGRCQLHYTRQHPKCCGNITSTVLTMNGWAKKALWQKIKSSATSDRTVWVHWHFSAVIRIFCGWLVVIIHCDQTQQLLVLLCLHSWMAWVCIQFNAIQGSRKRIDFTIPMYYLSTDFNSHFHFHVLILYFTNIQLANQFKPWKHEVRSKRVWPTIYPAQ